MRQRREWTVYAIALALAAASWIYNVVEYRTGRLPEGGFLTHYIEAREQPGAMIDFYYVANNGDPKLPVGLDVEGLSELRFYPVEAYWRMNKQTIYRLMGQFGESMTPRGALEPLVFSDATVRYSDGSESVETIGHAIVYRDEYPLVYTGEAPFHGTSSMGSSDGSGAASFSLRRPAELVDTGSRWLTVLGEDFEYDVTFGKPSTLPVSLERRDQVTVEYRYRIPGGSSRALESYRLLLAERFKDEEGRIWTYDAFANHPPTPSEAAMRDYVGRKRREAK